MPDYIYIEEEHRQSSRTEKGDYFQTIETLSKKQFSVGLRVLTAFMSIGALAIGLVLAVVCLVSGALAALLFFQSEAFNANFRRHWKWFRRACAFLLGLSVATFSPTFGFGILILYFMLQGEKFDNRIISRFVNY